MRATMIPGLTHRMSFRVTPSKTVPAIYPESAIFAAMPPVFATGYMVALMEWCCTELMAAHLEPGEGSLGTQVEVSHVAATPVGMEVTVEATLEVVDGRKLLFRVTARDERDLIGEGRHGRAVVKWDKFLTRMDEKAALVGKAAAQAPGPR